MTALDQRPTSVPTRAPAPARTRTRWRPAELTVLVALVVAAGAVRLPFLTRPLGPDEAGFALVARQWHPGTSLYGDLWVDRPPLLIALFRAGTLAGDLVGGAAGVRLLGCAAAMATTLLVALTVATVAGRRAALVAAVVTIAGLSTPLTGAVEVDGELLAAPFVALSLLAVVRLLRARGRRALLLAALAGAATGAAVMVKQNMLDGAVFFAVAALLGLRGRGARCWWSIVGSWAVGAVAAVATVLGLAAARGTSPAGVWFALYPFRLQAMRLLTHVSPTRRSDLLQLELLTCLPLVVAALAVLVALHWRRSRDLGVRVVGPAVLACAAYDVVSIAGGGSFWAHYLIEPVVPVAVGLGVLIRPGRRLFPDLGGALAALALVAPALAWCGGVAAPATDAATAVGESVGAVAAPHDTIVSAFGDAGIVSSSGLPTGYRYLWSLPARTLDPDFAGLGALLAGPHAPTWLVVRNVRTEEELRAAATAAPLRDHYHEVAEVCGRIVLLRDGVTRATPTSPMSCASESEPLGIGQVHGTSHPARSRS